MGGRSRSENDLLIELKQIRAEIDRLHGRRLDTLRPAPPRRRGSFDPPVSPRRLRGRVGTALAVGLVAIALLLAWVAWQIVSRVAGACFEALLPHPVVRLVSGVVGLVM